MDATARAQEGRGGGFGEWQVVSEVAHIVAQLQSTLKHCAEAAQAGMAAQDSLQRERAEARKALPSVFTVRVLGFGNEAPEGAPAGGARERGSTGAAYDPKGVVQVLGAGALTTAQMQSLTPGERRNLKH